MWVPAWSGIEMNIDESPCTLPDSANDFLVGLPDAVDDGRMAWIARGTVVEFTAEIDDLHDWYPLRRDDPNGRWTGAKCWRFSGLSARQPKGAECHRFWAGYALGKGAWTARH